MLKNLETNRLLLRPIKLTDAEDMYEYGSVEGLGTMAGWTKHEDINKTKKIIELMIAKYLSNDLLCVWAIVLKENNKMIGTIEIHSYDEKSQKAELGFTINNKYWGMGLTFEASKKIIEYGFEVVHLIRLAVEHFDFNKQSKRVIEKCGFKFEGILRDSRILPDGRLVSQYVYSILKDEYFKKELPWQKED